MNKLYERLNHKLDSLTQKPKNENKHKHKENTQTENSRVINLTNITFTKEQINTLKLGPQYATEKNPKLYINELIIYTENAIRHLQSNIQNTFRYLTAKKIKQIKDPNRHNTLHKRHQHNINQIKKILQHNNLTIAKADKSKAKVIIDKTELRQKIDMFIQESNIIRLNKGPTESYHRQLQQTMQKCDDLIEKNRCKYLLNIEPTAPRINAYTKTHKGNKPIRPVIDNTQTPSYKIAKFLNTRIKEYINLPNTYTIENSYEIAQELHKIQVKENYKIVTLDIKDLYVNLPKHGITQSTIFWLDRNNINKKIKKQIIQLLNTIIEQNYFQYNNQLFRPENGIAMGSPISGTLAEIYLQQIEELYIKHWIESQEIIYYKRYVDDIIIIFDQHGINEATITSIMNNINEQLEFKATKEINQYIIWI
jgi:hypothetical protein